MFGENTLNFNAASYEEPTPALPAHGGTGTADGIGGDGMGNVSVGQMLQQTYQQASAGVGAQPMPPPPPGALVIPVGNGVMAQHGQQMQPQMDGYTWQGMEPQDTSEPAALRSAGFTALLIATCVGAGVAVGGPWGAAAGLLVAGAAANGYRAQKWWDSANASEKHEAVVSGIFAAGTAGMGAYAAWKAYQAKQEDGGSSGMKSNRSHRRRHHDDDDDDDE
jgi:hypothetical protein